MAKQQFLQELLELITQIIYSFQIIRSEKTPPPPSDFLKNKMSFPEFSIPPFFMENYFSWIFNFKIHWLHFLTVDDRQMFPWNNYPNKTIARHLPSSQSIVFQ